MHIGIQSVDDKYLQNKASVYGLHKDRTDNAKNKNKSQRRGNESGRHLVKISSEKSTSVICRNIISVIFIVWCERGISRGSVGMWARAFGIQGGNLDGL